MFCPFDFGNYPFDDQDCNITYGTDNTVRTVKLLNTIIKHGNKSTVAGQESLQLASKRLPYLVNLTGLQSFALESDGYEYPHAGFTIHFSRNEIANLIGSFYGPTGMFAVLSLISYNIHPDVVIHSEYAIFSKDSVSSFRYLVA